MLPHAFPFRFVDRPTDDRTGVQVQLTSGASVLQGAGDLSPFLAVEVMAQAAMSLLAPTSDPTEAPPEGRLAGVEQAIFHGPLRAGDSLVARATLLGRYGRVVKAAVTLETTGQTVAECHLLLAAGP